MEANAMILKLNRQSHTPLYLQIADQVKGLIAQGALKIGDRLPPSRELAVDLGVHRTTASNAYGELEADGIINAHVGRGTFIAAYPRETRRALDAKPRPSLSPLFWNALFVAAPKEDRLRSLLHVRPTGDVISFAYALPSPDLFPMDDLKRCVHRVLRREGRTVLQMGESFGYMPLREYLAGRLAASGIRASADEILISNGCQQSLDLIRRVLVGPGDAVLIENPTYPGALTVFDTKDIKCIGVPVGDHGVDLNVLEDLLSHHRAKLLYTTPTFHNPTGAAMDLTGRRRLLDLALKYHVPIVEDDIYGDLRYDGPSIPSLKALDEHGVVIHLGSFSKMGFPGLRVGWVAAPRLVIDRLGVAKQSCDLHTNLLAQVTLFEFSKHSLLSKHLKRIRRAYAERRDRMLAALKRYFPEGAVWARPEGGMSVWVTLPLALDATHVLPLALQAGIAFSPGATFYLTAPRPNTMRLTFTTVTVPQIEDGVRRLGALLKRQLAQARVKPAGVTSAAQTALV
jgi:DNA-binding transcriptional MocR family regulator